MEEQESKTTIAGEIKETVKSDKRFYVRLGVAAIILIVLYFIFSPYQNCVRAGKTEAFCVMQTGW